jgi:hypothetical protein
MIRRLRQRHRLGMVVLAATLPALYLIALGARPGAVLIESLPGLTATAEPAPSAGRWEPVQGAAEMQVRLTSTANVHRIEIRADRPFAHPDLLVYWSAPIAGPPAGLPPTARLLGPASDTRTVTFRLPEQAGGEILLYSLAHEEIIGRAPIPPTPDQETG